MRERMREKVWEMKRNLLLEGVSSYFEQTGFYASTMQEIAKAIGMSVGALYKFFPSKEALFYAYMTYQIDLFYEALQAATAPLETPEAKLKMYIRMKFEAFRAKRKAIEDPITGDPLFLMKMKHHNNNPASSIFQWLSDTFEAYGRQHERVLDDPMKTAYLFQALTTGYVEYWLIYDGDFSESDEEVFHRFLRGVLAS